MTMWVNVKGEDEVTQMDAPPPKKHFKPYIRFMN